MNYRLLIFVSFILGMMTCSSSPEMQKSPFPFKETYQGIELLENGNPVFFYQRKPESLKGQYICTNYLHPLYIERGALNFIIKSYLVKPTLTKYF